MEYTPALVFCRLYMVLSLYTQVEVRTIFNHHQKLNCCSRLRFEQNALVFDGNWYKRWLEERTKIAEENIRRQIGGKMSGWEDEHKILQISQLLNTMAFTPDILPLWDMLQVPGWKVLIFVEPKKEVGMTVSSPYIYIQFPDLVRLKLWFQSQNWPPEKAKGDDIPSKWTIAKERLNVTHLSNIDGIQANERLPWWLRSRFVLKTFSLTTHQLDQAVLYLGLSSLKFESIDFPRKTICDLMSIDNKSVLETLRALRPDVIVYNFHHILCLRLKPHKDLFLNGQRCIKEELEEKVRQYHEERNKMQ